MEEAMNTNRIAREHETEVAAGYAAAGFTTGGRIRRNDYGQSEPDVVVGSIVTVEDKECRVTIIAECKARDEGYPATLRGWHDQNDKYAHRHVEDVVVAPIHVKNRPGRGGKVERFVSIHEQEWFDILALIAKKKEEK